MQAHTPELLHVPLPLQDKGQGVSLGTSQSKPDHPCWQEHWLEMQEPWEEQEPSTPHELSNPMYSNPAVVSDKCVDHEMRVSTVGNKREILKAADDTRRRNDDNNAFAFN
jgi:hypothetical protein